MEVRAALERCADRTLDFGVWFGGDALPLDGLLDAAEVLADEQWASEARRHVQRWVRRTEETPISWIDQMTPGSAVVRVGLRYGEPETIAAAERLAQFMDDVPRSRWLELPLRFPRWPNLRDAVLVDSLYYDGTFFYALAHATGDETYFDKGSRTLESLILGLLGSSESGFFPHAVNAATRRVLGDGWGRGSGYALLGLVDALELLPPSRPEYARIAETFSQVAARLLPVQDDSGFWRTILQDREAYLETSTAAFFSAVFAKGIRLGLLDRKVFEAAGDRALGALLTRIDEDGRVFGVSGMSFPEEPSAYLRIATEWNSLGTGRGDESAGRGTEMIEVSKFERRRGCT